MEWLVLIGGLAVAWLINAGKIVRLYIMTDAELLGIHEKVKEFVTPEIDDREDRTLVTALIAVESGGNSHAISATGAVGLMQIEQPALDDYNDAHETNLRLSALVSVPAINVRVGYWYLKHLEDGYNLSRYDALRAYNVGLGTVRADVTGGAGAGYAVKVTAYAQRLKEVVT